MNIRGRRRFGAALWGVGVVVAAAWAFSTNDPRPVVPGIARAVTQEIAAVNNGRLARVAVELHGPVVAGDVVAEIDSTELDALREVAAAEFLAMSNADPSDPKAHTDAVKKRASTLQLQTELAMLDRQIEQLKDLVKDGAASQSEVDDRAIERKSIVARIQAKRAQNGSSPSSSIGPSAWAIVASLKRLEAVDARIDQLKLKSAMAGRVSAVMRRTGEVVRRGDPIIRIAQDTSTELLAYVPPHQVPKVGAAATVLRADGSTLKGTVVSVSPSADLLPETLWKLPGRSEHGITVVVQIPEGKMVPNEALRVQL